MKFSINTIKFNFAIIKLFNFFIIGRRSASGQQFLFFLLLKDPQHAIELNYNNFSIPDKLMYEDQKTELKC